MRIKSLHIDNFGKLHNLDLTFTDGLNATLGENGYGKSTLAAFIRAMFYGLPNKSKNNTDRAHYAPFNLGGCGGSITFEADGKEYVIRRSFGATSAKDTFFFRENGAQIKQNPDEVGQKFFGLDEGSFKRLIIIANNQLEFGSESVATKLGALAGGLEPGAVTNASKELAEEAKKIQTQRGQKGAYWDNRSRLAEIDARISQIEQDDLILIDTRKTYQRLKAEKTALSEEIAAMDSIESTRSRKESYDERLKEIKAKESNIVSIKAKYPSGLPSEEEIQEIRDALNQMQSLEKNLEEAKDSTAHFVSGFPEEEELKVIGDDIGDLDKLNGGKVVISSFEKELYARYEKGNLTAEDVQETKKLKQDYLAASSDNSQGKGSVFVWPIVAGVLGIVLIVLASILLQIQLIAGIVLYSAGGIALLSSAVLFGLAYKKKQEAAKADFEKAQQKAMLGGQISSYLKRFGIQNENLIEGLGKLESESGLYLAALESGKLHADDNQDEPTKALADKLGAFFAKYGYEENNYHAALAKMNLDIENARKAEERKTELKKYQEAIDSFKKKHQIQEEVAPYLSQVEADKHSIAHIEEEIKKGEEWAEAFGKEHPEIFNEEIQRAESVEALRAKEQELDREIASANSKMTTLANNVASLDGLRHEQDTLKQKNEQLQERRKLLLAAKKHLENAEYELKEKYVGPVKNVFNRYSKLIEDSTGLPIELDADFNLTYKANGEYRDALHLSDGEKMAVSFCLRLAFLENMYKDEKVFVILDDPFLSLDQRHLNSTLSTLDGLQDKFQLLYLTCHESRMPKSAKN